MGANVPASHPNLWQRRVEAAAYLLLALLALALRLSWLDQIPFAFDQARVSALALAMARGGDFASVGMQSSIGVPNLPGAVWIVALFYRVSSDPLVATAGVGLLNALGVLGLGWVARRAWGPAAGLAAAALLATSPWAVFFSRSIWAQNLLPPLAILWACCGYLAVERRSSPWLAAHLFLAGFAPQVHFSGLALWPGSAWLLWRYGLWRRGWDVAAGAGLAALAAAPYLRAVWPMRHNILAQLGGAGGGTLRADLLSWQQLVHMGIGAHWQNILAGDLLAWTGAVRGAQQATTWVLGAGLLAGAVLLLRRVARPGPGRDPLADVTLAWGLTAPLLLTVRSTLVYHHHTLVALPALMLVVAAGVGAASRLRLGRVLLALVLFAAAAQAVLWTHTAGWLALNTEGGANALKWPRALAHSLAEDLPIVVYADCDWAEVCEQAAIFQVFLWNRDHRVIDSRNVLLIPAETADLGAHLVVTPSAPQAWDAVEALGWPVESRTFLVGGEHAGPYRVATVPRGWLAYLSDWTLADPLTLSTGAQLYAWRAHTVGERVRLQVLWRISGPIAAGQYQQFNHLYADGDKVDGQDGSVSIRGWQPGDWLVTHADLTAPAGARELSFQVGMYSWPELERAAILERPEDGERAIRLGPILRP